MTDPSKTYDIVFSNNASALKTLQQCGLNPQVYDTVEKAAEGVAELIENLREQLNDPDHHTQTLVLKKLQVEGFCDNPKLRLTAAADCEMIAAINNERLRLRNEYNLSDFNQRKNFLAYLGQFTNNLLTK